MFYLRKALKNVNVQMVNTFFMTVLLKRTNKLLLFYCNVKFQRRDFKWFNAKLNEKILITQVTRDI